jgi:hypothetical protein
MGCDVSFELRGVLSLCGKGRCMAMDRYDLGSAKLAPFFKSASVIEEIHLAELVFWRGW